MDIEAVDSGKASMKCLSAVSLNGHDKFSVDEW